MISVKENKDGIITEVRGAVTLSQQKGEYVGRGPM